jgi:hypothetical protein
MVAVAFGEYRDDRTGRVAVGGRGEVARVPAAVDESGAVGPDRQRVRVGQGESGRWAWPGRRPRRSRAGAPGGVQPGEVVVALLRPRAARPAGRRSAGRSLARPPRGPVPVRGTDTVVRASACCSASCFGHRATAPAGRRQRGRCGRSRDRGCRADEASAVQLMTHGDLSAAQPRARFSGYGPYSPTGRNGGDELPLGIRRLWSRYPTVVPQGPRPSLAGAPRLLYCPMWVDPVTGSSRPGWTGSGASTVRWRLRSSSIRPSPAGSACSRSCG